MNYEEKIPEFALQPAREADESSSAEKIQEEFDPTPYDRLLVPDTEKKEVDESEIAVKEKTQEEIEPVVFQGESLEDNQPVSAEPVTITPLSSSAVYSDFKVKTMTRQMQTKVFIEEDILVPDTKPDLVSILLMDGNPKLSGRELQIGEKGEDNIHITGEILLKTLYLPQEEDDGSSISLIQSRLPIETQWQISASPMSNLIITPEIVNIEHSIINERKFRAKITLNLTLKEYAEKEIQLFDSIQKEKLEMLRETVTISSITARKEESADIAENLKLKEGSPKPVRILKADIRTVENHKQVTSEKIVLNAGIWVNVLYIGEAEKDGETCLQPVFYQGKTDFTQFILINKEENLSAEHIFFDEKDLEISINEEEDGFNIKGTVQTNIEIIKNIEKEMVSDFYHNTKEMTYDVQQIDGEVILTTVNAEASSREVIDILEQNGTIDNIVYITGRVKEKNSILEQGRVSVNGIMEIQILCIPKEKDKKPFSLKRDAAFRSSADISVSCPDPHMESRVFIKDLWFDRINGKQAEINASIQIQTEIIEKKTIKIIKNPCFIENKSKKRTAPMVVYVTKRGDTMWGVAKKYKTSVQSICEINEVQENTELKEGMRLLIVK